MKICSVCQRCYENSVLSCPEENHEYLIEAREGSCEIVPNYRLEVLHEFSAGGETYRAVNTILKKPYFIKIIEPEAFDETAKKQFLSEAQSLASIIHPNVARIFESGTLADGSLFVVTEFFTAQTLRECLVNVGAPSEVTALTITRQVAEGLEALHAEGVLHRNIRPENIILTSDAENRFLVKLENIDFGAIRQKQVILNAEQNISDLRYFSPEQCTVKETGTQTDVYSLGIVLFETLAGQVPFDSPYADALIKKQIDETPPPIKINNFDIRMLLTHTLTDALQKTTRTRLKSANAFARRIRHIEQLATHSSTPPPAMSYPATMAKSAVVSAPPAKAIKIETPFKVKTVNQNPLPVEAQTAVEDLPLIETSPVIESAPLAVEMRAITENAVIAETVENAFPVEVEKVFETPSMTENQPLVEMSAELGSRPVVEELSLAENPAFVENEIAVEAVPVVEDLVVVETQTIIEDSAAFENPVVEDLPAVEMQTSIEDSPVVETQPEAEVLPVFEVQTAAENLIPLEMQSSIEDSLFVETQPVIEDSPVVEVQTAAQDLIPLEAPMVAEDSVFVESLPVVEESVLFEARPEEPISVEAEPEVEYLSPVENSIAEEPVFVEDQPVPEELVFVETHNSALVEAQPDVEELPAVQMQAVAEEPVLIETQAVIAEPVLIETPPEELISIEAEPKYEDSVLIEARPADEELSPAEIQTAAAERELPAEIQTAAAEPETPATPFIDLTTTKLPPIEAVVKKPLPEKIVITEISPIFTLKAGFLDNQKASEPVLVDWEQPDDLPTITQALKVGKKEFADAAFVSERNLSDDPDDYIIDAGDVDSTVSAISEVYEMRRDDEARRNDEARRIYEARRKYAVERSVLSYDDSGTSWNLPDNRKMLTGAGLFALIVLAVGGTFFTRQFQTAQAGRQTTAQSSPNGQTLPKSVETDKVAQTDKLAAKPANNLTPAVVDSNEPEPPNFQPRETSEKSVVPVSTDNRSKKRASKETVENREPVNQTKTATEESTFFDKKGETRSLPNNKTAIKNQSTKPTKTEIFSRPRIVKNPKD